jgi:hypothetical protein
VIQITPQVRILVAIEAVDLRKGIDSLAQFCREKLDSDPFSVCVPQPAWIGDQGVGLRWAGLLAGSEAAVEGALCVVAERDGAGAGSAGPPSSVAVGSWQPGDGSTAGVATRERIEKSPLGLAFHFRSGH